MKYYSVYLGCYEQHKYSFKGNDVSDICKQVINTWPTLYSGSWNEVDASGCPKGSRRFIINNIKPCLIMLSN
jgi:hypothetical protein